MDVYLTIIKIETRISNTGFSSGGARHVKPTQILVFSYLRDTSPSNHKLYKFDIGPPGHDAIRSKPMAKYGSKNNACALPKATSGSSRNWHVIPMRIPHGLFRCPRIRSKLMLQPTDIIIQSKIKTEPIFRTKRRRLFHAGRA